GKFFEGLVVFMTGVALPLITLEFGLQAAGKGMVSAATLFGILIGATALGGLADRYGRKQMFIIEMALFVVFLIGVTVSPSFPWLIFFLFGIGVALGCDYPTAHVMISESTASSSRGGLVLSAFAFQAVGALGGMAVGLLILSARQAVSDWRWMFATAILPALLVVVGRFFITQSGHWLMARGRVEEAERETQRLLRRQPPYPKTVKLKPAHGEDLANPAAHDASYKALFSQQHRRATILASVPWFLQDLGTYGIGIFTPTILAATLRVADNHVHNLAEVIHNDILAAKGAAMIDVLLIMGIVVAVCLADRVGRMRLQIFGFIGCAVGLLVAALSAHFAGGTKIALIFVGFMLFNFMTNLGPNAMTYLIAGEVFPTRIRGLGAGFAASFAKVGAVLTAFLFPILLKDIGTSTLLYLLVGTSLLGAVITWQFAIETKGLNLEEIGHAASAPREVPRTTTPP
ncbi:MAG: MFS transporter, partial [Acidobacteria bacterium]|nr:MFS transporter [Acidobacteriota bacterium]